MSAFCAHRIGIIIVCLQCNRHPTSVYLFPPVKNPRLNSYLDISRYIESYISSCQRQNPATVPNLSLKIRVERRASRVATFTFTYACTHGHIVKVGFRFAIPTFTQAWTLVQCLYMECAAYAQQKQQGTNKTDTSTVAPLDFLLEEYVYSSPCTSVPPTNQRFQRRPSCLGSKAARCGISIL